METSGDLLNETFTDRFSGLMVEEWIRRVKPERFLISIVLAAYVLVSTDTLAAEGLHAQTVEVSATTVPTDTIQTSMIRNDGMSFTITEPVKVVTKQIEPFVFVTDGVATGFSIDVWAAVAEELDLTYQLVIVDTIDEQLNALIDGEADVGIAAISITKEREEKLDFTLPYFESGLGILTAVETRSTLATLLAAAFSPIMLRLLAGLALLIVLAGHVVWLLERNQSGDFSKDYLHGVWAGAWWAAATVTTVGYGDHVPRQGLGRIFGLLWMVAGVFILANFTANVTTELTVNRLQTTIHGPQDLAGKRLGTVEGSSALEWLNNNGLPHRIVSDIDEAYSMLDSGPIEAIVYDYPVLLYHTLTVGEKRTEVAGEPFSQEDYGIAVPTNSPLREEINLALLDLYERGIYDAIANRWLGVVDSQ